ncbi:MAG: hypothetical protein FWF77_00020 [Defluviitaleaceae bacterium]|nr:hypothetical protein [Defluviitaleaceae bacterium]
MEAIIKKLAEKKFFAFCLLALVAVGAAILIVANRAPEPHEILLGAFEIAEPAPYATYTGTPENFSREEALEQRLEEFFSLVEGAGNVRVMVSPLGTRETVFAVDTTASGSHTQEQDAQGGTRETRTYQNNERIVLLANRAGQDVPLVLREVEPRIEGIVIIAEGGDSPFVRDALTRAARAVLGLEAHNIQILNMQD